MNIRHRAHILKGALLILWIVCVGGLYLVIDATGIPLRQVPALIRREVLEAGWLGPLLIIGLYIASTIIFFSKAGLDIISGAVYGPFLGSLFVLIGLNAAAVVSFYFGRYFGHHFVQEHAKGWMKKYDEILEREGFITVLVMRLLFFPFDIVSFGCGMSRMSFREFVLATCLGSMPGTITFVVLGGAITNPRTWLLFAVLLAASLGLAFFLRRSSWIRRRVKTGSDLLAD
ncbi:MAG: TVP38/TMEM64 family protein [Candidatus Uhrbacteria bacterium]|nr:TVP38/TMEM64 family protein [Candidatus Uhrbacteria bacterium]